jgi:hypothetical protein
MSDISTPAPRPVPFDYTALTEPDRQFVADQVGAIRSLVERTAADIIDIGRRLLAVKDRLPYGQFGDWLAAEFAMTARTAQNFMNVARAFKNETVSDLRIGTKALYMLASPSVPETVREEAIERSEAGEHITPTKARELIDRRPWSLRRPPQLALLADLAAIQGMADGSPDAVWKAEMSARQRDLPAKKKQPFADDEHREIADYLIRSQDWYGRFALRLEKQYGKNDYATEAAQSVARRLKRLIANMEYLWHKDDPGDWTSCPYRQRPPSQSS